MATETAILHKVEQASSLMPHTVPQQQELPQSAFTNSNGSTIPSPGQPFPGYQYPPGFAAHPNNAATFQNYGASYPTAAVPMPIVYQPGMQPGAPPGVFIAGQQQTFGGMVPPQQLVLGFDYFATLDSVLVKQKREILELLSGMETNNRYQILNAQGQMIFHAVENTDCCTRQCCGSIRPFNMKLLDAMNQEVIHLSRPLACGDCCFPCCLQSLQVEAPPGNLIGSVNQIWGLWTPKFEVMDESGRSKYYIQGPFCTCSCCSDVDFRIYDSPTMGMEVGKVSKKWMGFVEESVTDADNFSIVFPKEADGKMKAVLLGACILIDFMYFENNQSRQRY